MFKDMELAKTITLLKLNYYNDRLHIVIRIPEDFGKVTCETLYPLPSIKSYQKIQKNNDYEYLYSTNAQGNNDIDISIPIFFVKTQYIVIKLLNNPNSSPILELDENLSKLSCEDKLFIFYAWDSWFRIILKDEFLTITQLTREKIRHILANIRANTFSGETIIERVDAIDGTPISKRYNAQLGVENLSFGTSLRKMSIEGSLFQSIEKRMRSFFIKISKNADGVLKRFYRKKYAKKIPIKNNRIFMFTYDSNFICNEKYIAEEIIRRNLDVEIVWGIPYKGNIDIRQFPEEIRLVRRGTESMISALASSKIWIENGFDVGLYHVKKKKAQVAINTWHGSMGIKKLSGNKKWLRRASQAKKYTNYCITNSDFEEEVFRSTFWPNTPFLKYGHARNDLFFNKKVVELKSEGVRRKYGISDNTKILLYAPTFREAGMDEIEPIDFSNLKDNIEKRFGGKWAVMIRWHHKERARKSHLMTDEFIIDASDFGDMQELLCAIDIGISDYSSWVYDFILTGRPIFLYIPDIDAYDQERGFYYSIDSTPFPLAYDNDELREAVHTFDIEKYHQAVDIFLKERGCYEQGNACVKIVDAIEKIINGEDI